MALAAAGVVAAAAVLGVGSTPLSPEPVAQAFLYAWETGQYQAAAAMTTGRPADVVQTLAGAYRELGAADLAITMAGITSHGNTADARFDVSVNLGRGGLPWNYQGQMRLRRTGAAWKVMWSPSVVVPGLRAGDRLAVLTTLPARAPLVDAAGQPLMQPSPSYQVGVRPGHLADPRLTAQRLAAVFGFGSVAAQIQGQILAAPSADFLELVQLDPADYRRLAGALSKVPGLIIRRATARLFDSIAPAITGAIGTETAKVLLAEGVPYRPGATVGLSGLEQAYQRELAGTATTQVEVETAVGHQVAVLKRWPGKPGIPVRTTIDSAVQRAAQRALAGVPGSAAIVAIRAGSGQILAVADAQGAGLPPVSPLAGQYPPGQSFTMISTAALIADSGFRVSSRIPCVATNQVGGRAFTNSLPESGFGPLPPFRLDFAHACSTAFLGPSLLLTGDQLAQAASQFGIGRSWRLPLPTFPGSMQVPSSTAEKAADTIGTGSVRVNPLDMALAAGVVESGSWHPPSLVTSSADPVQRPKAPLSVQVISELKQLMGAAVLSGAARPAGVPGRPVSGQVGLAPVGTGRKQLYANWFVGYRGNVAFAIMVLTRSPGDGSAAPRLAGQFAGGLPR